MSLPIVYISNRHSSSVDFIGRLDHVHVIETGECLKDRAGDCPISLRMNRDPFRDIQDMHPHSKQSEFIGAIVGVVNMYLGDWGKDSGKTVARKMLAKAILRGDTDG